MTCRHCGEPIHPAGGWWTHTLTAAPGCRDGGPDGSFAQPTHPAHKQGLVAGDLDG